MKAETPSPSPMDIIRNAARKVRPEIDKLNLSTQETAIAVKVAFEATTHIIQQLAAYDAMLHVEGREFMNRRKVITAIQMLFTASITAALDACDAALKNETEQQTSPAPTGEQDATTKNQGS